MIAFDVNLGFSFHLALKCEQILSIFDQKH